MDAYFTESHLDSILIGQKDKIIDLINQRKHDEARIALNVVKAFWYACNYGYKLEELQKRVDQSEYHSE